MKFPIVIHQKPTVLEIISITSIIAITFIPFIYGIESKQPKFCFSLIVGVIGFKLFNIATKNKFTLSKIIQKDSVISFSKNYIEINKNQNQIIHKWSDLKEIEIDVFAYKGRYYESEKTYDGIENSIKFMENGQKFEYRFFIDNVTEFKLLKELFNKTISPQLEQFNNLKEISHFKSLLNFSRKNNRHNDDYV